MLSSWILGLKGWKNKKFFFGGETKKPFNSLQEKKNTSNPEHMPFWVNLIS